MMLQKALAVLAVPIALLAVLSANAANTVPDVIGYAVKLNPDASGNDPDSLDGNLRIKLEKGLPCKPHKATGFHHGCMLFEKDTIGLIRFYLPGSRHKEKCSPSGSGSPKRVITKIQLSTEPKPGDDTQGEFGGEVAAWLKDSAFPGVDASTGVIYEKPASEGETTVLLVNENSSPFEPGKYHSFWYRVEVTDCENAEVTTFDPRGDNEGLQ